MFMGQDLESMGWGFLSDDLATREVRVTGFTGLKRMVFLLYLNLYILLQPQCLIALSYKDDLTKR